MLLSLLAPLRSLAIWVKKFLSLDLWSLICLQTPFLIDAMIEFTLTVDFDVLLELTAELEVIPELVPSAKVKKQS